MSPQPTAAPATDNGPKLPHIPADAPKGSPIWAIGQAMHLERERAKLGERITANRDFCRNLLKMDALDDDTKRFVEVFYPEKEKGSNRSEAEVEATRKLRDQVRKAK